MDTYLLPHLTLLWLQGVDGYLKILPQKVKIGMECCFFCVFIFISMYLFILKIYSYIPK